MMLLSANQIKAWDAFTTQHELISSIDLMERASLTFVNWYTDVFNNTNVPVDIFCGNGNNGGDGLAIARLLRDRFYIVSVHILRFANQDSIDFAINLSRLMLCGDVPINFIHDQCPPINPFAIIIDALLGTGVNKPAEGKIATVIQYINARPNTKISVDMPSGLPAEGMAIGPTLTPDYIFTFQLPKQSFFLQENQPFCKSWIVGDIGLHPGFLSTVQTDKMLSETTLIKEIYKPRSKYSHKGNFGHALILAGSIGKIGAAILATKACLRTGTGLVTACVPPTGAQAIHLAIPEAMVMNVDLLQTQDLPQLLKGHTLGIGAGLGTDDTTIQKVTTIIQQASTPMVIDADALNIISLNPSLLTELPKKSILTPHPKEFERLFGKTHTETERFQLAKDKAMQHQVIIVLKGAHTRIFTPDGLEYINSTGNPGMATAGSGDVLTGIITGLLALGYGPEEAAILGVYIHGLAGDLALRDQSVESLIATDIIEHLGAAYKQINN